MKLTTASLLVALLAVGTVHADVIKPSDVRGTSQFGVGSNLENLVNGDQGPAVGLTSFGLISAGGPGILDDDHDVYGGFSGAPPTGWITGCFDGGIDGGSLEDPNGNCSDPFAVNPPDGQIVEFEFDGSYDLTDMHIWNANEDGSADTRGLDEFEIQVSPDRTGNTFTAVGTTFNLNADTGLDLNNAQVVSFDPNSVKGIRRVRLIINSNHDPNNEDYVGLAEVRFEGTLVDLDLAADADADGMTTGLDFLAWQVSRLVQVPTTSIIQALGEVDTTFNSTLTATKSEGDFDNNNVITSNDLAIWEGEYGQTSLGANIASVPEPGTIALGIGAFAGSLLLGRRRKHRHR